MHYMFYDASSFNQDLSSWCVSKISSIPYDFDYNSGLTSANLPQWGTCPVPPSVRISSNNVIISDEANSESAVDQVKLQEITLFPNPTTGMVKISPLVEGSFKLFNEIGRLIDQGKIKPSYDLKGLENGLYILLLQTDNESKYFKLIKQ